MKTLFIIFIFFANIKNLKILPFLLILVQADDHELLVPVAGELVEKPAKSHPQTNIVYSPERLGLL